MCDLAVQRKIGPIGGAFETLVKKAEGITENQ
jgi:hypothetical protein